MLFAQCVHVVMQVEAGDHIMLESVKLPGLFWNISEAYRITNSIIGYIKTYTSVYVKKTILNRHATKRVVFRRLSCLLFKFWFYNYFAV